MNHCVPDFQMDDDYTIHPNKSSARGGKEEIMELLWHNGQLVMHSQRSAKKPLPDDHLIQPQPQPQQNLFVQEDEMSSWLLNDAPYDFCSDLFYSTASPCVNAPSASMPAAAAAAAAAATATTTTHVPPTSVRPAPPTQLMPASKPPIPPSSKKLDNFGHLSRLSRRRADKLGPSNSNRAANESTVVDSSDTPADAARSLSVASEAIPHPAVGGGGATVASSSAAGTGNTACEITVTSSTGGSSASAEPPSQKPPPPPSPPPPEDRKRKAKGPEDADSPSEDVDLEYADTKKRARSSSSTKRSRAAEVHNLSERRRRDRINEKMRALQELIPHSNKADKASMLDEAIEYLKNLQSQVQFMSMGCGMVPMMFPGVPPYMPHMGMGIGMGMGMEMGMNRPMMPFPNVLAGSPLSAQGAAAHMGPRFPMPAFHMQHIDPSRGGVGQSYQADPLLNTLMMQNPNHPRLPNFGDPYQQYLQHLQLQQQQQNQNQAAQQGTSKPSSSKGAETLESPKSG